MDSVSDKLHRYIEKHGVAAVTLYITLISILFSVVITYLFHVALNIADPTIGLMLATLCPLLITPPMSFVILKLVDQLRQANVELISAREEVETLASLLPMCAWCRKIRDGEGYWSQLESYLSKHTNSQVTHAICPECAAGLHEETGGIGDG